MHRIEIMMPVVPVRRDEQSAEFFDAAARGELAVRQCRNGHFLTSTYSYAGAAVACPECYSTELDWVAASGQGRLVSWTAIHARGAERPQLTGLVELAEGPWIYATILTSDPRSLAVDQPLTVEFIRPGDGEAVPAFRPV
jgi:uncharacterized protein